MHRPKLLWTGLKNKSDSFYFLIKSSRWMGGGILCILTVWLIWRGATNLSVYSKDFALLCTIQATAPFQVQLAGTYALGNEKCAIFKIETTKIQWVFSRENAQLTPQLKVVRITSESVILQKTDVKSSMLDPKEIFIGETYWIDKQYLLMQLACGSSRTCSKMQKARNPLQQWISVEQIPLEIILHCFDKLQCKLYTIDHLSCLQRILISARFCNQNAPSLLDDFCTHYRLRRQMPKDAMQYFLAPLPEEKTGAAFFLQHIVLSENDKRILEGFQLRLSSKGELFVDLATSRVEIIDFPENVVRIFEWIVQIDKPTPQFYVEAQLFFCSLQTARSIGEAFFYPNSSTWKRDEDAQKNKKSSVSPQESHGLFSMTCMKQSTQHLLRAFLNQLETDKKLVTICNPIFILLDKKKAILETHAPFHGEELLLKPLTEKEHPLPSESLHFQLCVTPSQLGNGKVHLAISLLQKIYYENWPTLSSREKNWKHACTIEACLLPGEEVILGGYCQAVSLHEHTHPTFLEQWPSLKRWIYQETSSCKQEMLLIYLVLHRK